MLLTINAATLNRPDFQGTVDAMLSTNYFRGDTLQIVSTKSTAFVDGEAILDLPPTTGNTRYFIWIKDTANKKVAEYVISVPDGWAEANLRDLIGYTDNIQDQDDFGRLVESVAELVVSDEDFIEQVASGVGTQNPVADFEFQRLDADQSPTFQLSKIPTQPQLTILTVMGIKQAFGVDFVIDGLILQWLGFSLQTDWNIEVLYK